ncbi:MAG: beta-propeller domain-containing protein [Clostridiales bacterium]|nr:beta-propeller domain-containing protein [Clostridiales bacterium]
MSSNMQEHENTQEREKMKEQENMYEQKNMQEREEVKGQEDINQQEGIHDQEEIHEREGIHGQEEINEQEILNRIKEETDKYSIPESLKPENICAKLSEEQQKDQKKQMWWKSRYFRMAGTAAAAVLCLCVIALGHSLHLNQNVIHKGEGQFVETDDKNENLGQTSGGKENEAESSGRVRNNAGDLYVVAKNYEEVKQLIEQQSKTMLTEGYGLREEGMLFDDVEMPAMEEEAAEDVGANAGSSESAKNYSSTNLQTEGVDESDLVKTDGNYIYTVNRQAVYITDIRKASMKKASKLELPLETADHIQEIYVDGDRLCVLVNRYESNMKDSEISSDDEDVEICVDVYYIDSSVQTVLFVYDISDRTNPKLQGEFCQDGDYNTSRKVGDMIYLFTNKWLTDVTDNTEDWIPKAGGREIAADSIYLPKYGNNSLVISSVDINHPETSVDQIMIVNDFVQIYVGTENLYLYSSSYEGNQLNTKIAGFSFRDGEMDAIGSAVVPGSVNDTFAVSERDGQLRILTTEWDSDNENGLYLFDKQMKLTGKLTGLAKGEQIYAARFIKDMVYFVTYRETDPLFAVDLSDPTNPRVLSELKITGFSEYIHLWDENQLLGIGYETDPETGDHLGLKLTMFDISDPGALEAIESKVLKNVDYSSAFYSYKQVLVDSKENLIGFPTESYGESGCEYKYVLYTWTGDKFRLLMEEEWDSDSYMFGEEIRGLYADERFYLVDSERIISYDRTVDYKVLDELKFD